jgi:hypothetical protein
MNPLIPADIRAATAAEAIPVLIPADIQAGIAAGTAANTAANTAAHMAVVITASIAAEEEVCIITVTIVQHITAAIAVHIPAEVNRLFSLFF